MKRSLVVTSAALLTLTCVGVLAARMASLTDYSQLPPEPSEIERRLDGLQMSLGEAVLMAEAEVNGRARAVALDMSDGARASVEVYADDAAYEVSIDLASGEVVSANERPEYSLPGDAVEGEPTVTQSGLKYYDIEVGDGEQPAGPQSTVSVHYTGWLVDGTKFDSSRDRGQPASFPLGNVIPGWTEGVGGMRVGGTRKLIIPANLGYGERGAGGVIPPGAMLIFDVELLNVNNPGR